MFKSAFCTHWKQKHRPHSEDSAPSNHRWGGLFTFSEVKWADKYQIGSNGSINNSHFTDELVLTEGEIVQYGTTTGGFQQNFGVFTNFNNVFYDLLLSYFMPGPGLSKSVERENSAVNNSTAVSPTRFKL